MSIAIGSSWITAEYPLRGKRSFPQNYFSNISNPNAVAPSLATSVQIGLVQNRLKAIAQLTPEDTAALNNMIDALTTRTRPSAITK